MNSLWMFAIGLCLSMSKVDGYARRKWIECPKVERKTCSIPSGTEAIFIAEINPFLPNKEIFLGFKTFINEKNMEKDLKILNNSLAVLYRP